MVLDGNQLKRQLERKEFAPRIFISIEDAGGNCLGYYPAKGAAPVVKGDAHVGELAIMVTAADLTKKTAPVTEAEEEMSATEFAIYAQRELHKAALIGEIRYLRREGIKRSILLAVLIGLYVACMGVLVIITS